MPTIGRRPKKSGAAKAAEKLGGLLPGTRGQKRGASGGRGKKGSAGQKRGASGGPGKKGTASRKSGASGGPGKKGTAGLALLAGAAGLLVKNREKLTSMIRGGDSSRDAVTPGEPQATPVASNSGPVDPAAIANPPTFPDHPAA